MARINVDEWIPEEYESAVLQRVESQSAIEAHARRVPMATDTKEVPRSGAVSVDVISKGSAYDEADATLDTVTLKARKFGKIFVVAEEDLNDSLPDVLQSMQVEWATSFARKFDNAALGVTQSETGLLRPYSSVYFEVTENASDNHATTDGDVSYDHLSEVLSVIENGDYFDEAELLVIGHPSFRGDLRGVKDTSGNPIFVEGLAGTPDTIFGHQVHWTHGARTSAEATDAPDGNPLLVAGNRQFLLNGVRSGPESMVSYDASFETDEPKLKVRARRGFAVGRPEAFAILEKTAAE